MNIDELPRSLQHDICVVILKQFKETIEFSKGFKGELQCKTTQKEVREGANTSLSSLIVFELIPQLRELRNFLEKVVLLDRRSAWKRNRIARSLGGEGNRIARSFEVIFLTNKSLFSASHVLMSLSLPVGLG